MKRIIMAVACTLAACEGEPPKVPVGATPAAVVEAAPAAPTEAPEAGAPAPPAPVAAAGPCCNCCPTSDAGTATDAAAQGAAGAAAQGAAAAPTEVAKVNVTGTVTTAPAALAANAVVFLVDAPVEPTAKMGVMVDNVQMTFAPYIAVVPVGGHVVFHNSDPFPHNVFSPDNDKFNLGNVSQGVSVRHTFKTAGEWTVLCNLHPGMIGYVVVTPSSYFAKADAKGRYTIKNVPAGTYKVAAWAPRQAQLEQSVTVASTDVTLDFQLHR